MGTNSTQARNLYGSFLKLFIVAVVFLTGISVDGQVYLRESFSSAVAPTTPPAGWSIIDNFGSGQTWHFDNPGARTTLTAPFSGKWAMVDSDNYGSGGNQDTDLETPAIDVSSATKLMLDFDLQIDGASGQTFDVDVWDGTQWTNIYSSFYACCTWGDVGMPTPITQTFDITTAANFASDAKVRFNFVGSWDQYAAVDNIFIYEEPTCLWPNQVALNNITGTSVDVSFTSRNSSAAGFQYVIGAPGFDPATATPSTLISGTSAVISGLTGETDYDVYIRDICSQTSYSYWSGPWAFKTACALKTAPLVEDFESVSTLPDCWSVIEDQAGRISLNSSSLMTGTNSYFFTHSWGTNSPANYAYLIMPEMSDLNSGANRLNFNARFETSSYMSSKLYIGTLSDRNDETTFSKIDSLDINNMDANLASYTILFNSSSAYNLSDQNIAFSMLFTGNNYSDIIIDDINYEKIPLCQEPTNFTSQSIDNDSILFAWSGFTDTSAFRIKYVLAGVSNLAGGTEAGPTANGDSTLWVGGLMAETAYDFYLKEDCSPADSSAWVGPFTVTTNCDPVYPTWMEDFEGTGSNVRYDDPACWTRMSSNYYSSEGGLYEYSSPKSGSWHLRFYHSTTWAPFVGLSDTADHLAFVTPKLKKIKSGNYRLGLSAKYTSSSYTSKLIIGSLPSISRIDDMNIIDSLDATDLSTTYTDFLFNLDNNSAYNNTDEYLVIAFKSGGSFSYIYVDDVIFEKIPLCPKLDGLTAYNVGLNSADLTWTANYPDSAATTWEVLVTNTNTGDTAYHSTSVANDSISISGLMQNQTSYSWQVREHCALGGDTSLWSNVSTFLTSCGTIDLGYTQNFDWVSGPSYYIPACWDTNVVKTLNVAHSWAANNAPIVYGYRYSGRSGGCFRMNLSWAGENQLYGAMPESPDLTGSNTAVTFWAKNSSSASPNLNLEVGTMTDPTDPSTWSSVETVTLTTTYQEFVVALTATNGYNGTDLHIAFRNDTTGFDTISYTSGSRYIYIDDLSYNKYFTCTKVSDVYASNVSDVAGTVHWTSNDVGSSYIIEYDTNGVTVNSVVTDTFIVMNSLQSQTTYNVGIRELCSVGDTSDFTWYSFTTDCNIAGYYAEDLNTTARGQLPACWSKLTMSGNQGLGYIDSWNGTDYSDDGTNALRFRSNWNTIVGQPEWWNLAVSPYFSDMSTSKRIAFDVKGRTNPDQLIIGFMDGKDDTASFTLLDTIDVIVGVSKRVSLPLATVTSSHKYIGFRQFGYTGNRDSYIGIDNFVYEDIPSCLEPTDLYISDASSNSFQLNWTSNGDNLKWVVEVDSAGTIIQTQTVTDTFAVFTGLQSNLYKLSVVEECIGKDTSYPTSASFNYLLGANCALAIPISSIPYADSSVIIAGYANDYVSTCGNSTTYSDGEDIVYTYSPANYQQADVFVNFRNNSYNSFSVLDGCPDDVNANCIANYSGYGSGVKSSLGVTFLPGKNYFIVVDTWYNTTGDMDLTIEKSPPFEDIEILGFNSPVNPIVPGYKNISVDIKNKSNVFVDTIDLGWTVNNVPQAPVKVTFGGDGIAPDSMLSITIGGLNMPITPTDINVWVEQVNNTLDANGGNSNITETFCGPLAGNFVVGPSKTSDFATINDALDALVCGASGAVTLELESGPHTGNIQIDNIPGLSSTNTLTIDGIDASLATISGGSYAIHLDGVKHVTIKNVTLSAWGTGVQLNNGADSVEISDCIFNGTGSSDKGILATSFVNTSSLSSGDNSSSLSIFNNEFMNLDYGINAHGFTSSHSNDIKIVGNSFAGMDVKAIWVYGYDNVLINNNSAESNAAEDLILLSNGNYFDVKGNNMHTTGASGFRFVNLNDGVSGLANIVNNMITASDLGIRLNNTPGAAVYHNSIAADQGIHFQGGTNLDVQNNIFSGGSNFASREDNSTFLTYDYNLFFATDSSVFDVDGDWFNDLGAYQASSTLNANSVIANPRFVNSTDLHMTTGVDADGAGTLVGVSTDIDNDSRTLQAPDMGADEYTPLTSDISLYAVSNPVLPCVKAQDSLEFMIINNAAYSVDFSMDSFKVYWEYLGSTVADTGWISVNTGILGAADTMYVMSNMSISVPEYEEYDVYAHLDITWDEIGANDTLWDSFTRLNWLDASPDTQYVYSPYDSVDIEMVSPLRVAEVDFIINWPYSGRTYIDIYDQDLNFVERICDPTNCYTGSTTAKLYNTTISRTFPPGNLNFVYNGNWSSNQLTISNNGNVIFSNTGYSNYSMRTINIDAGNKIPKDLADWYWTDVSANDTIDSTFVLNVGPKTMDGTYQYVATLDHAECGIFTDTSVVIWDVPVNSDIELTTYGTEYSKYPTRQADLVKFRAEVENLSYDNVTDVYVAITESATQIDSIYLTDTLGQLASTGVIEGATNALAFGSHTVLYNANPTDANGTNNSGQYTVEITDTVFARDNGMADGGIGFRGGNQEFLSFSTAGEVGQTFHIYNSDTITAASFYINDANNNSDSVRVKIWSIDTGSGEPDEVIGMSEYVVLANDSDWYRAKFNCTYPLDSGMYLMTVEQTTFSSNMGLGYSLANPTEDVVMWKWNFQSSFSTLDETSSNYTQIGQANLMLRAEFGVREQYPSDDAPTLTTSDSLVLTCINSSYSLSANPVNGGDLVWYNAFGTRIGTGTSYDVPTGSTGITEYRVYENIGQCRSNKADTIEVEVGGLPGIGSIDVVDESACAADDGQIFVRMSGGTPPYQVSADGGTTYFTFDSLSSPSKTFFDVGAVTGLKVGLYQLTIQDSALCSVVDSSNHQVFSAAAPNPPTPDPSVVYCEGEVIPDLNVSGDAGADFTWYADALGQDSIGSGASFAPFDTVIGLFGQDYYVSQSLAGCKSTLSNTRVTILDRPATPAATVDPPACEDADIKMSAPFGYGTYVWYSDSDLTMVVDTARTVFPPKTLGANDYYVAGQDIFGCWSLASSVTVQYDSIPNAPVLSSNQTECEGGSFANPYGTPQGNGELYWYTDVNLTSLLNVNDTLDTISNAVGYYQYYVVEESMEGCVSDVSFVSLTINTTPSDPNLGAAKSVCLGETPAPLTTGNIPGTTTIWYSDSDGTMPIDTSAMLDLVQFGVGDTVTSYSYYAVLSNGLCSSPIGGVDVNVTPTPEMPTASSEMTYCTNDAFDKMFVTGAGGDYKWYLNGNMVGMGDSLLPNVTSQTKTFEYVVTESEGVCESGGDTVVINTLQNPFMSVNVFNAASCTVNDGSIEVVISGGTGNWSSNSYSIEFGSGIPLVQSDSLFSNLGVGTYTVNAEDSNCVATTQFINVGANSGQTDPASIIAGTGNYCQGDTLDNLVTDITADTMSGVYEYKWYLDAGLTMIHDAGDTVAPIDTIASIDYYVTRVHDGCVSLPTNVNVTVNGTPDPMIVSHDTTYCLNETRASLSAMTASMGTLNWFARVGNVMQGLGSGSSIPAPIKGLNTRIYLVENLNGCESDGMDSVKIDYFLIPGKPSTSVDALYCHYDNIDEMTAMGDAGNMLDWYTDPSLINHYDVGDTVMPTISGNNVSVVTNTYYVTQTDINNCVSAPADIEVRVNPTPSVPSVVNGDTDYCDGDVTTTMTASGNGGTYIWYDEMWNAMDTASSFTQSSPAIGDYTFYLSETNVYGCESYSDTTLIVVNENPTIDTIYVTDVTGGCTASNGVIEIIAADGDGMYDYSIDGGVSTQPSDSLFDGLSSSSYAIVVYDGNGCEIIGKTIDIDAPNKPDSPVIVNGDSTYCDGDDLGNMAIIADSVGVIKWYYDVNLNSLAFQTFTDSLGMSTATPDDSVGALTYYVSEDNIGCQSTPSAITITINALPSTPSGSANVTYCDGDSLNDMTVTGAGGTYSWYDDMDLTNMIASGMSATPSISTVGNTNYYVTEMDGNGCISVADVVSIHIDSLPDVSLTSFADVCANSGFQLLSGGLPFGGTGVYSGTAVSSGTFDPDSAGVGMHAISYSWTDGNGCENIATQMVNVDSVPNVSVSSLSAVCANEPSFTLTNGSSAGTGSYSGTGVVSGMSFDAMVAGAGLHSIKYSFTDSNSCTNSSSTNIEVYALPAANAGFDTTICDGQTANLMATGGTSYAWSNSVAVSSNPVTPTVTTTYGVMVTDANNCSESDSVMVTVNALPTVTFGTVPSVCDGSSPFALTQGSPSGGTYSGVPVSFGTTFDPSFGAANWTVTYTYTDGNGCINDETQIVTIDTLPSVSMSSIANMCEDASAVTLNQGLPMGGQYSGTGVSAGMFDPATAMAGSHMITYTFVDGNTCSNTASQNVTVDTLPNVTFAAIPSTCEDGDVVNLTQGTPSGGTYTGSGVTGSSFDPAGLGTGSFTITYDFTDNNGCSGLNTADVTVNANPTTTVFTNDTALCNSKTTATLDAGAGFDTYDWSTGASTQTIDVVGGVDVTNSETFTVTVTDNNGCSTTAAITVSYTEVCVGITENIGNGIDVVYYPNPTSGVLNMDVAGLNGKDLTVEVMTMDGQLVMTKQFLNVPANYINQIDLSDQAQGVYFIKLSSDNVNVMHRVTLK